jgi:hypothetical protein
MIDNLLEYDVVFVHLFQFVPARDIPKLFIVNRQIRDILQTRHAFMICKRISRMIFHLPLFEQRGNLSTLIFDMAYGYYLSHQSSRVSVIKLFHILWSFVSGRNDVGAFYICKSQQSIHILQKSQFRFRELMEFTSFAHIINTIHSKPYKQEFFNLITCTAPKKVIT